MKDITFEVLIEHVCDANYITHEDPFDFPRPCPFGQMVYDSDRIKNYMKYQTVIHAPIFYGDDF